MLDHVRELVAEEQRLYQHHAPTDADQERLQKVKIELDQYWDLLRQRRALEEFGRDPADAHLRPAGAPLRLRVERHVGYKHAKYVNRIEAVDRLSNISGGKGGFWEDRGYQWYAGL